MIEQGDKTTDTREPNDRSDRPENTQAIRKTFSGNAVRGIAAATLVGSMIGPSVAETRQPQIDTTTQTSSTLAMIEKGIEGETPTGIILYLVNHSDEIAGEAVSEYLRDEENREFIKSVLVWIKENVFNTSEITIDKDSNMPDLHLKLENGEGGAYLETVKRTEEYARISDELTAELQNPDKDQARINQLIRKLLRTYLEYTVSDSLREPAQ